MITLKTLPQASAQEVFDQVAKHLLTQNARAQERSGFCAYKSKENLKCAAGCLIADDEYDFSMENGYNWLEMVGKVSDKITIPYEHSVLIRKLQKLHDSIAVELWKEELALLAENDGLIFKYEEYKN